MTNRVRFVVALVALGGCAAGPCAKVPAREAAPALSRLATEPPPASVRATGERIVFHDVRIDERGLLLPALDAAAPFAEVPRLGFRAFAAIPDAANGKKPYFSASMFTPTPDDTFAPHDWLINPTGLAAMLVRSTLRWYAWSGDSAPLEAAKALVDHVLAHGLTRESDDWASVPYASANGGELEYRGGDDVHYCDDHTACGRGDGRGFLEPDKIGEFGHALVALYRFTGDASYRAAAVRCANALVGHMKPGDGDHSPWPFRVDAATGKIVREAYTSNWVYTVAFFDALADAGEGTEARRAARDAAWAWLRRYPMANRRWQAFFEDIPIFQEPGQNPNQYSAGETALYLLDHPDDDADSVGDARAIATWIEKTFAVDVDAPNVGRTPGHWYGAEVISEQKADMAKMGSHTARYGALLARLYEATGDAELRARARRSLAWATYCIDDRGVVKVGPDDREGYWFSDGYGDYLVHFLDAMAAVPAWAPAGEAHVLRTSDLLVDVVYAARSLHYRGVGRGREELRVPASPTSVKIANVETAPSNAVEIEAMAEGGALVTIRRRYGATVDIAW